MEKICRDREVDGRDRALVLEAHECEAPVLFEVGVMGHNGG